jgi:rSAM/selenodomain-associated transferase 1
LGGGRSIADQQSFEQLNLSERLIIFAKAPRPGEVKTRLIPELGKEGACAAYIKLVERLASNLKGIPEVTVFYSPVNGEYDLRRFFPAAWRFQSQSGADLGERLAHAFEVVLEGAAKVVAIGSDCPYISEPDIRAAFDSLEKNDVVLGPATDGGYWLIGMKQFYPSLFEGISWGSSRVFEETISKAQTLKLRAATLRKLSDIDAVSEWEEFCRLEGTASSARLE